MDSTRAPFRADLRCKYIVPGETDIDAFMAYPCNPDQWEDALMGDVYEYIRSYKWLNIPSEWHQAMAAFDQEYTHVRMTVAWIKIFSLLSISWWP